MKSSGINWDTWAKRRKAIDRSVHIPGYVEAKPRTATFREEPLPDRQMRDRGVSLPKLKCLEKS